VGLSIVEHLATARDSTRQIHPGLGDQRRLPKAGVQATHTAGVAGPSQVGPWSNDA